VWAFGATLFRVYTGEDLLKADDSGSISHLKHLYNWKESKLHYMLDKKIQDERLRDLLTHLLHPDPGARFCDMHGVIKHAFFTGAPDNRVLMEKVECIVKSQDVLVQRQERLEAVAVSLQSDAAVIKGQNQHIRERTDEIREHSEGLRAHVGHVQVQNHALTAHVEAVRAQNSEILGTMREMHDVVRATLQQVKLSEAVLRRALFQVSEFDCPRCFIVLPFKLEAMASNTNTGALCEYAQGLAQVCECVPQAVDQAAIAAAVNLNEGSTALGKLQVPAGVIQGVGARFNAWVKAALFDHSMWLYLVDEYTGRPVTEDPAGTYPIEITAPRECLRKLVPLMSVAIAAMYAHNGVAGIAQLFGVPAPRVPPNLISVAATFSKALLVCNSAAHVECLQKGIAAAAGQASGAAGGQITGKMQAEAVCGAALREFRGFLEGKDRNKRYAGLHRVMTPCGAVMWTACRDALRYCNEDGNSHALLQHEAVAMQRHGDSVFAADARAVQSYGEAQAPGSGEMRVQPDASICSAQSNCAHAAYARQQPENATVAAQQDAVDDGAEEKRVGVLARANFAAEAKQLSKDICTVCGSVREVQREVQRAKLEAGMPIKFAVKKRVKRTPGIRATRWLTLELRDGEPVMVNRCAVMSVSAPMCLCLFMLYVVCWCLGARLRMVYVCMYVCLFVCLCMDVNIPSCTLAKDFATGIHLHIHVCTYRACKYLCVYKNAHKHTFTQTTHMAHA
jgi:hypothetical protein